MRIASLLLLVGCDRVFQLTEVTDVSERDGAVVDVIDSAFSPDLLAYYPLDAIADGRTAELVRDGTDALCAVNQCPVAVAGTVAGALDFDGVDDMLQVSGFTALETAAGFSVTVWMRQDAALTTDDYGCVAGKRYGTNELNSWQLCLGGFMATNLAFYSTGTSSSPNDILYTGEPFPLDEWHHVAFTFDGVEKALYLDGTRKARGVAEIVFDGGDVLFGADIDSTSQVAQFPGRIDDVRFFNRALSASEILAAMQ